ncbi:MAG: FecR family protein [Bacteroides sp.]
MEQHTDTYKLLVKKLLTGTLQPQERAKLNEQERVKKVMQTEWEETSELYANIAKEKKIFHKVLHTIQQKKAGRFRKAVTRYSWVASLALLLLCGTLTAVLFTRPDVAERMYVVNSGRQSMDSVRLPDGTFVMLNAGSRLTYPEVFTGENREVTLSGQAFFQVEKDEKHPFIVKTNGFNVTALGTSFEVFSFDQDESAETILLGGKVKVETIDKADQTVTGKYFLNPNEKLTYTGKKEVQIESVDANSYSAWRMGGRLSFKNEKLSMILPRLEKWYGQKIICPQKVADYYRFTFTVRTEPLELILNIMSNSAPLSYTLTSSEDYVLKELRHAKY